MNRIPKALRDVRFLKIVMFKMEKHTASLHVSYAICLRVYRSHTVCDLESALPGKYSIAVTDRIRINSPDLV